jgi:Mg/Co/Ni transporter MgtE
MDPDEDDDTQFFQYVEDEDGASLVANMSDEDVTEILAQFLQRNQQGYLH